MQICESARRSVVSVVAMAALLLAVNVAIAQTDADTIVAYLDQVRHQTGAPGVSAAVAVDGEIVFSGGAGYAELDNRTPATGATVWNVGSVSKVMAGIAIMQLVEQGKVGLDDAIRDYVSAFPDKGVPITIRQILTHTSGIRHYRQGEFGPHGLRSMRFFDDLDEAIQHFTDDPLLFEPGTLWFYSSHAYNLLQGVVEQASGLGFEDYMRAHVWEPAGMLNSSFDVPSRVVHRRGRGYTRDDDGTIVNSRYEDVSYKYAGGGMLSTVNDMARMGAAINDGALIGAEAIAQMHAPHVDPVMQYRADDEPRELPFKQALGWDLYIDASGRPYISKTGTVRGTRSVLVNYPDHGVVVAVQANIVPFDSRTRGVAIAQMFLPPVHAR
jgi:CubicO group peptidase (beta-lactamase class C family)